MDLKTAIMSHKPFKRRGGENEYSQYFKAGTGPKSDVVDSEYFLHGFTEFNGNLEYCFGLFSTSIDLYVEDIVANDWEILEE